MILGCIGYELLNYAPDSWRDYVRKLGAINWQESDAIWTSTIRQRTEQVDPKTGQTAIMYKKLSAYSAVAAAIDSVRKAIGWQKPDPLLSFEAGEAEAADQSEADAIVLQD